MRTEVSDAASQLRPPPSSPPYDPKLPRRPAAPRSVWLMVDPSFTAAHVPLMTRLFRGCDRSLKPRGTEHVLLVCSIPLPQSIDTLQLESTLRPRLSETSEVHE